MARNDAPEDLTPNPSPRKRGETGIDLTPNPSPGKRGETGIDLTPNPSPGKRGETGIDLTPNPSPGKRGETGIDLTPNPSPGKRGEAGIDLTPNPSPHRRGARGEVRAIVFDIGATLVTGPPVAPNKVIAGLLGNVSAAEVAAIIMTKPFESPRDVISAIETEFGPIDSNTADGIEGLWESQVDAAVELEGATEAVLALKDRGFKIGLLSDIWSPYYASVEKAIPRVIESADAIVLSCETGRRKPAPHNFIRVLADLEVGPEVAVMVGDTYQHDILPALELGMRTVWVLARPDREIQALVRVLNGKSPTPTQVVWRIGELAEMDFGNAIGSLGEEVGRWT